MILNAGMFAKLEASALNVDADVMNQLVNPHTANLIPAALLKPLRGILYAGLHNVYSRCGLSCCRSFVKYFRKSATSEGLVVH